MLSALKKMSETFVEGAKKILGNQTRTEKDFALNRWLRQQMAQEYALGEAIVENRPFTLLTDDYIERWDVWERKHFRAYGDAVVGGRSFCVVGSRQQINH